MVIVSRCSLFLVILMATFLAASGAEAAAPSRLAVVFANSKYSATGELRNPAQDGQLAATNE
jgi:hypothetical protein